MNYQDSLTKLIEGNKRYYEKGSEFPNICSMTREKWLSNQKPYAIVVGCADSRIPPEIIFDQGIGDIFVIRVAGNIASNEVIASVEYAVAHLGTELIMVLGHDNCGAVKAAFSEAESEFIEILTRIGREK